MSAGGGYTKHNVARCWTAETAVLLDQHIAEELPPNDYYDYYAPDYRHVTQLLELQPCHGRIMVLHACAVTVAFF